MNPVGIGWQRGINTGLIGGIVLVLVSLIGMVEAFAQRDIVAEVVSMGHTLLGVGVLFFAFLAAKRATAPRPIPILVNGLLAGIIMGGALGLLVLLGHFIGLRSVFINASPLLFQLLTF